MINFSWYNNYPETARPLSNSWQILPPLNIGVQHKIFPNPAKMSNPVPIGGYVGSKCQRNDDKPESYPLGKLISSTLESIGKNKLCNSSSQASHLMRNLIPNFIHSTISNIKIDLPVKEITEICQGFNFEIPNKQTTENINKEMNFGMPVYESKPSAMPRQEVNCGSPIKGSTSSTSFCFEIPFWDNPKIKEKRCFRFDIRRLVSESSVESDNDFIVFESREGEDDTCDEESDGDTESDSDAEDNLYVSYALQVAAEDSMKAKSSEARPIKKVRFKSEPEIRVMRVWDFASRQARIGPWGNAVIDRHRFQARIDFAHSILSPILTPEHRSKIRALQLHDT